MSFAELIRTVIPVDDDPGTLRRWRIMTGLVILTLVIHAVWGFTAGYSLRAEAVQRMDYMETKVDRIASRVDRSSELQLIQLTRSLYEQQCRAQSEKDKSDLQIMIDRYEQEYRRLTREPMPRPAVRC